MPSIPVSQQQRHALFGLHIVDARDEFLRTRVVVLVFKFKISVTEDVVSTTENYRALTGKWKAQELMALKFIISFGSTILIATGFTALIVANADVHRAVCHVFAAMRVILL